MSKTLVPCCSAQRQPSGQRRQINFASSRQFYFGSTALFPLMGCYAAHQGGRENQPELWKLVPELAGHSSLTTLALDEAADVMNVRV